MKPFTLPLDALLPEDGVRGALVDRAWTPGSIPGPSVQKWMNEQSEETRAEQRDAWRRLQTLAETTDGFRIAEVDLELRGPGDVFGTRQSGAPVFTIASLVRDQDLLSMARKDAFELVDHDPDLRRPEHRPLREYFVAQYGAQTALGDVA